jgi:pimeloyl-ACP methyl ester carboxylesterase
VTVPATFVLVHGAWQGGWAWETFVPRLEAAGHRAIAVDLPGNGDDETPPADVDVNLYARHLTSIIDAIDGPVVLLGHSMGGTAVAQACELRPDRVALAVYLAAFLLSDGVSVMMFYDRYLEPWMRGATTRVTHSPDGLLSAIDPTSAVRSSSVPVPLQSLGEKCQKMLKLNANPDVRPARKVGPRCRRCSTV